MSSKKFDAARQQIFLERTAAGDTTLYAAKAAGVSRRTVYDERDSNDAFRMAWADADEDYKDKVDQEIRGRAMEQHADSLLLAPWKTLRPELFTERKLVATVSIDAGARDELRRKLALRFFASDAADAIEAEPCAGESVN
jgi:hypothetical protein